MNTKFIVVNHQFEATHRYPGAPDEVDFLRNNHRHIFHIELAIEVFHDDRELEFIMVKRDLKKYCDEQYSGKDLDCTSCEMIAVKLQYLFKNQYPKPASMQDLNLRLVNVKVMEDNENGAYIVDSHGGRF